MPTTSSIPVAILVRVSTSKQETTWQLHELTHYANGKGYAVVGVCREVISGSANAEKRGGLQRVEETRWLRQDSKGAGPRNITNRATK